METKETIFFLYVKLHGQMSRLINLNIFFRYTHHPKRHIYDYLFYKGNNVTDQGDLCTQGQLSLLVLKNNTFR
jgi:hypothetical protein